MYAYEIATSGKPSLPWYSNTDPIKAVRDFIRFVEETRDPVVKGLVSIMAGEIQHQRMDGVPYLGGNLTSMGVCISDSESLLARILLDKSSHGEPKDCFVDAQLRNIAHYIHTEEDGNDSVQNWLMAERRYVREGLKHLADILVEEESKRSKEKVA